LQTHGAKEVSIVCRSPIAWVERDFIPNRVSGQQVTLGLGGLFWPLSYLDKLSANFVLTEKQHGSKLILNKKNANIMSGVAYCKPPVLDIGLAKLIKEKKITVLKETPKSLSQYDVVVKCIGYNRELKFSNFDFSPYLDSHGIPRNRSEMGLYFLGYADLAGRIHMGCLEAQAIGNELAK
jgi:hypothetical protein